MLISDLSQTPPDTTTQVETTDAPSQEVTTQQNPLPTTSAQLIPETTVAAISNNTTTALITEPIELTTGKSSQIQQVHQSSFTMNLSRRGNNDNLFKHNL